MSRAITSRLLATALVLGTLLCGRYALASASSVQDLLAGGLLPSAPPALLAPITSEGRVGWACKPEKAAADPQWRMAELPGPGH